MNMPIPPPSRWPRRRRTPEQSKLLAAVSDRGRLRPTAHRLFPQAAPLLFQTARARYAGRRLIAVVRDCRPARYRTRQSSRNPSPPVNRPQSPEDAGSIPAASIPRPFPPPPASLGSSGLDAAACNPARYFPALWRA